MCKLFKSGPSKIDGRQTLQNLKSYGLPKQTISLQIFKRLSSTNFTWSILEYLDPCVLSRFLKCLSDLISSGCLSKMFVF